MWDPQKEKRMILGSVSYVLKMTPHIEHHGDDTCHELRETTALPSGPCSTQA